MNRRSSFGRRLGWILIAVCFLPVALRAEAPAPSTAGSPEPAIAAPAGPASTGAQRLTAIESTPGKDSVRVFLATGGAVKARPFILDSPSRLVIDLLEVESALANNRIEVGSPILSRVRVGQRMEDSKPVTRVVLDIDAIHPYEVTPAEGGMIVSIGGGRLESAPAAAGISQPPASGADDPIAQAIGASKIVEPAPVSAGAVSASPPGGGDVAPEARPAARVAQLAPAVTADEAPPSVVPQDPQGATFATKKITPDARLFTGKKISLNLVDADIKQVFRLFHEISGMNFVLDPGVSGNITIVLDEVPWDQALDLILKNNGLDKVYDDNVIRIATVQKLASESSGRKALKDAKELEDDMIGITRRLSYAKAKDIDQIIKTGSLLSSRGKSYFDDRTNTLIVADVPRRIMPLEKLISDLDTKTPQVMIEARVVLTGRDFLQDLGIQWGFNYTMNPNSWNFPNNGEVTYALNLPRAASSNKLGFNLFNKSGTFNLQLALDALETEGKSRVLSAPKIATQSNVRAEIEQGIQIPIPNNNAVSSSVQFVNATLKLTVTPQITAEDTVIMDIIVQNDRPNYTLPTVNQIPPIDTQKATTRVMVEDGGTTVIGGIFQVQESTSETGVPWLRKIPFFGWLFKSRAITTQNRELMIFITPKILRAS